jgi:DNA-binding response OmpR family regulator
MFEGSRTAKGWVAAISRPPLFLELMETILVIDDDKKLCKLLEDYLARFSYHVISAQTPSRGLEILKETAPALVLLDLMLPEMDGFEVCRRIRADSPVPIIMLTARGEVTDRVVGLELGADDYLPKPFEPRELAARIQAVLRRPRMQDPDREHLKRGEIEVDKTSRETWLSGRALALTTQEFDLLVLLLENPGRVFTRDQLMQQLRGSDWAAFDRSVDVMVSRLRRKLGDDGKHPRMIKTVWGSGYAWAGAES